MNQHTAIAGQQPAQPHRERGPGRRKRRAGHAMVGDGEMVPLHVAALHLRTEAGNAQHVQLLRLQQGDHGGGIPGFNTVQIRLEVAWGLPDSPNVALARREGEADDASVDGQFGDRQRIVCTRERVGHDGLRCLLGGKMDSTSNGQPLNRAGIDA